MEAVKNPGSKLAKIILPLAAFLPLCVERNQGQMPSLLAHILSTALQDWWSRAWLCTRKPVVRRHESLGIQIMVLFTLMVHLHPGWTGTWALGSPGPSLLSPLPSPTSPSLAQLRDLLTYTSGLLPLDVPGEIIGVNKFLLWKMRMTIAIKHLVLLTGD